MYPGGQVCTTRVMCVPSGVRYVPLGVRYVPLGVRFVTRWVTCK